jgi:hypothetical protein
MSSENLHLERIADAEGTGRLVNEQIARAAAPGAANAAMTFRCECGNEICDEPLVIAGALYERVRRDSMLFVVRPGHEVPEAEDVVEVGDGYEIVRKHEDVRHVVERSDPRRAG